VLPRSRQEIITSGAYSFSLTAVFQYLVLSLPAAHDPGPLAFHNPSDLAVSSSDYELLSRGLNFCVTPSWLLDPDFYSGWQEDFRRYERSLHRAQYFHSPDFDHDVDPADVAPAGMHIFSDFDPRDYPEKYTASPDIDQYCAATKAVLQRLQLQHRRTATIFNLSRRQRDRLRELRLRYDLHIGLTDKNCGPFVDLNDAYEGHCLATLMSTHDRVFMSEKDIVRLQMDHLRDELGLYVSEVDGNYYADGLDAWAVKWLMSSFGGRPNGGEYKLPQFYLLYKVHKPVLGFRPVTGNWCAVTQPVSRLLSWLLLPLVTALPTYVRDGDHVNRRLLGSYSGTTDLWFVTFDVVNLYPSIQHDLCVSIISAYLNDRDYMWTRLAVSILQLVLRDNYCTFRGRHWRQHTGFATGTAMGKEVAELYLHVLLFPVFEKWATAIELGLRFVDDGFVLFRGSLTDARRFVTELSSAHPAVTITTSLSASSGVFLDLCIFKDASFAATGILATRVHQKASNAYLYLHWRSETPRSTMAGIVKGEIGRYIKRCTTYGHFAVVRALFFRRLLRRGWPRAFLEKQFAAAPRFSQRLQLLRAKEPSTVPNFAGSFGESHLLVLTYTAAAARRNLTRVLRDHLHFLPPHFAHHTFRRVWRAQRKLGATIKPQRVYTEETTPPPIAAAADDGGGVQGPELASPVGGGVFLTRDERSATIRQHSPPPTYTIQWRPPEDSPVQRLTWSQEPTEADSAPLTLIVRSTDTAPDRGRRSDRSATAGLPETLHDTRPEEGPPAES
jgi:hypothetical protein